MAKNYLIGVGGTGSRVIESALHLCASGFGPEELNVFIIDPDEGNGNLTYTKQLMTRYQGCRSAIDPSVFDVPRPFSTNLKTPEEPVWSILEEKNATLAGHLHYENLSQSLYNLVSVFYSQQELNTALNEGFRGHPSIGAAVMSNPPQDRSPWREFWADVKNSSEESGVRVFVVGSIFGGTGAAGVPTFGAHHFLKFRDDARLDDQRSKVFLGGALVMPYFTFGPPTADAGGKMFVTPANFPIATKAALHYYYGKELGFDRLYFIGDSLSPSVGIFSPGNISQKNRPHYVELVTALAAFDFFRQPVTSDREAKHYVAGRETKRVAWTDLPVSQDQALVGPLQNALKARMVNLTAFSLVLSSYVWSRLGKPHGDLQETWYRDHFRFRPKKPEDSDKDPRREPSRSHLQLLTSYCRDYLRWAWEMSQDEPVDLLNADAIGRRTEDGELATWDVESNKYAMGRLLRSHSDSDATFDHFVAVFLNHSRVDVAKKPSDKLVGLVYQAAGKFCKHSYGLVG